MKKEKRQKSKVKINQFITPRALGGLWAAIDTTWFTLVQTGWLNIVDNNFKAFILIQLSFILIFLSIEKPSVTDFIGNIVEASYAPDLTDEIKMEMVKESIGKHLNFWEFLSYKKHSDDDFKKKSIDNIKKLSKHKRKQLRKRIKKI